MLVIWAKTVWQWNVAKMKDMEPGNADVFDSDNDENNNLSTY